MKLNNKGWGLFSFLIIVGILFLILILVALMANDFDNDFPSSSRRRYEINIKA